MSEKKKKHISYNNREKSPKVIFVLLLVLNFAGWYLIKITSRSQGMIMLGNSEIPASSFTGVFSSIANICLIFLVVFYDKAGFITALALLLIQVPELIVAMIVRHTLVSIPGLFTNAITITAIILIYRRNRQIEKLQDIEVSHLKEQQMYSQHLFEQTATALVNAIDAKDEYSHGHSLRVAEYSEKIAREMGKTDEECYRIYYTGLLHDVGKIGIANSIINKKGKLTEEEYNVIKQHTKKGQKILSSVREYPYLSLGAHFHHERYDGKGYPKGLKGEDIPEIARIISVADAYDAMTSNRSYRDALPQQLVREEIIKGSGTQFDPGIAKVMKFLIDNDPDYKMKERDPVNELGGKYELECGAYRSDISDGIRVTANMTKIHFKFTPDKEADGKAMLPVLILFDSLDEHVHDNEDAARALNYFEYCEIRFDGEVRNKGARNIVTNISDSDRKENKKGTAGEIDYDVEVVRYKDHILIRIDNGSDKREVTVALPDSTRYAYIGLTGAHCIISDVNITKVDEQIGEGYITRIAEEISFIKGPSGDIPNVQVDGYRTDASVGVPISNGLKLTFHSMSLPTARLVWHCPYIDIFYSDDKRVGGENYREYALVRFDGENWDGGELSDCRNIVNNDRFVGWEAWKKANKEGLDFTVTFKREGNVIITETDNLGLSLRNETVIKDGTEKLYVAITGDQCAVTDIHLLYS